PYPGGSRNSAATWIGSLGIGVSSASRNPEMATHLAAFLSAGPNTPELLLDGGRQIPSNRSTDLQRADDDSHMADNKTAMLRMDEDYGRPLPGYSTYNAEWYTEFFTNIQPVLDGDQTGAEYCAWVQPRMQTRLDAANRQEQFDRGEFR